MTSSELESKIINRAERHKKYAPGVGLSDQVASIQYERILRERKLQQAREADERMKARAKCVLRFILPEVAING
jgi:hypothetical protein